MSITYYMCRSLGLTSMVCMGDGHPHFFLTDWQGNVIGVYDKAGKIEQRVDFYPSGEPWLEPEYTKAGNGNRRLFGAKESSTCVNTSKNILSLKPS